MLKIYIIGLFILVIAIMANGIALKLGIKSWYDFIELLSDKGTSTFKLIGIIDYLWLFIVYPLILGLGYLIGSKIHHFLFD